MQKVICAAIKNASGSIICGPRHFDPIMLEQINYSSESGWFRATQGFVDAQGTFLTREEAYKVALKAGQLPQDEGKKGTEVLISEDLY